MTSAQKPNGWHTRERRVAWLRNNPDAITRTRKEIIRDMKTAGLVRPTTSECDVNVLNLLLDAGYASDECEGLR